MHHCKIISSRIQCRTKHLTEKFHPTRPYEQTVSFDFFFKCLEIILFFGLFSLLGVGLQGKLLSHT